MSQIRPRRKRRDRYARISLGTYSLTKKGVARFDWADPYGLAVGLGWPSFLLVLFGIYLTMNALFALAYFFVPGAVANARPHDFMDNFFFSMETLATVGYGEMYPATTYGHSVAAMEMTLGLAFTAILTGLVFVRFARPRPRFVFADHPVVTRHNSHPTLMVRVGNGRAAVLAGAVARLSLLVKEETHEGTSFRRTYELNLVRNTLPVFPLSWTLIHEIDDASPLHTLDRSLFISSDARLFLSFEARDPDLGAMVHDVHVYGPGDVLFDMRYVDIIGVDEEGQTTADLTKISDVEPDPGADMAEERRIAIARQPDAASMVVGK